MTNNINNYNFIKDLESLEFIEAIYLFGSRATDKHSDRADIDIAINCPSATEKDWDKILKIIENADTLLKIDCVRFDQLKSEELLKKEIQKKMIILYTKQW